MAKQISDRAQDILRDITISNDNVVQLNSGQLERSEYTEVKKILEGIGGKWKGGKIQGFVFDSDPKERIAELSKGTIIDMKKEFQFFATPDHIADHLVSLADIRFQQKVLEPSAGDGAIVRAIHRNNRAINVRGYELMKENQNKLKKMDNFTLLGYDFLTEAGGEYDRIIANPPFAKNQDIDHIRKMYDHLKPGGRLVSIASTHWTFAQGKKESEFREWLQSLDADVEELPKGAFAESGTNVATTTIVINKPNA